MMKSSSIFSKLIDKLESYSLAKQFWILLFIATWDLWVMPLISIFLYLSGLSELTFFQAGYKQFLWNDTTFEVIKPKLITDIQYYHIYIYIYILTGEIDSLYVPGLGKPVIFLNVFHIFSFTLFLCLLIRSELYKYKKYIYGSVALGMYYAIGFLGGFSILLNILINEIFKVPSL